MNTTVLAYRGTFLPRIMATFAQSPEPFLTFRQLCIRCGARTTHDRKTMTALLVKLCAGEHVAYYKSRGQQGYWHKPLEKPLCP